MTVVLGLDLGRSSAWSPEGVIAGNVCNESERVARTNRVQSPVLTAEAPNAAWNSSYESSPSELRSTILPHPPKMSHLHQSG